jgi:thiamine monophosphate synthase
MTALKTRLRLYLVTDAFLCTTPDLVTTVRLAVANGVTMVQLREKTAQFRKSSQQST